MYGAQAAKLNKNHGWKFENDVEMYGAQANIAGRYKSRRLRMM